MYFLYDNDVFEERVDKIVQQKADHGGWQESNGYFGVEIDEPLRLLRKTPNPGRSFKVVGAGVNQEPAVI